MTGRLHGLWMAILIGTMWCVSVVWCHAAETDMSQERLLWQMAANEQADLEQSRVCLEDAVLEAYTGALVMRLWKEVQTDLPPMKVRVLVNAAVDASVYPNGVAYLTTGMLAVTRNQDQLAMILAHEMIHYLRRHSLSAHRHTIGDAAASGGKKNHESEAHRLQQAEQQADVEGVALMRKAGFCAGEAVAVLKRSLASIPLRNDTRRMHPCDNDTAARRIQWVQRSLESSPAGERCSADRYREVDHSRKILAALLADAPLAIRGGLWQAAAEDIERYLAVQPKDPRAHFLNGEIQRLRPDPASPMTPETAYLEAIRLDEQFGPAYQALGVLHFKAGRKAQAKPFFEKYLVLTPLSDESAYIRRYLQLCSQ